MNNIMFLLRDDYFNKCVDLKKSNNNYCDYINKFINYLCLPEVNLSDTPTRINIDEIEACIKYYYSKGVLNSRLLMESFLEAVKSFYDYLGKAGKTINIFSDCNYSKFKYEIIEKYNLLESTEMDAYDCKDIKTFLFNLDKDIDSFQNEPIGLEEEKYLQKIILRLFIKITLIAPAKKSVIIDIKKSDIREEFKKLYINGVEINITCGLSRDLRAAIKYVESKYGENIKESDNIFEYLYRCKGEFQLENLNTWFFNIAQEFGVMEDECKGKKTLAVEPIRNMVIQMMVDNMINPLFISKITGTTVSMLEKIYYSKDLKVRYENDINKCINKSVAQNDYYSYI